MNASGAAIWKKLCKVNLSIQWWIPPSHKSWASSQHIYHSLPGDIFILRFFLRTFSKPYESDSIKLIINLRNARGLSTGLLTNDAKHRNGESSLRDGMHHFTADIAKWPLPVTKDVRCGNHRCTGYQHHHIANCQVDDEAVGNIPEPMCLEDGVDKRSITDYA